MASCDFCERILFDEYLLKEDDALLPQHSLDVLEASLRVYSLYKLILWAAGCSLPFLEGMISHSC